MWAAGTFYPETRCLLFGLCKAAESELHYGVNPSKILLYPKPGKYVNKYSFLKNQMSNFRNCGIPDPDF